jgi:hypothetical protein
VPDKKHIYNPLGLYQIAIDTSHAEYHARAGVFHPSSVGYCMRANIYQALRYPPTDQRSKQFIEITTLGHAVHDILQGRLLALADLVKELPRLLPGIQYSFQKEVRYDPETDELYRVLGIGGTTDGILTVGNGRWKQRGIVEIKSQNNAFHDEVSAMPYAFRKHLMQSHLYAYRFDAPIIWVWYYNKNNSKHELKPQFFDPEIFGEAVDYFVHLHAFAAKRELPPREESYFECSSCVHRTACDPQVLRGASSRNLVPPHKIVFKRR